MTSALRTLLLMACLCCVLTQGAAAAQCVTPGSWLEPGRGTAEPAALLARMSRRPVLLLGETHDMAAHHAWQLDTLRALQVLRPDMVIGLEMLPRSAQPVLDDWVRGKISEQQLFERSDWQRAWGTPPELYAGIFRFAREHHIPLRALNIDRKVVRDVSRRGFAAVSPAEREGVGNPVAAHDGYRAWLQQVWNDHMQSAGTAGDDAFARFLDSQLLWDRAMAEALADAVRTRPGALVVGLMGSGHVMHGYGVAHQLRDLGLTDVGSLLPWDADDDCRDLVAGVADGVFGIQPPDASRP
ncbi:MAG TPA: ChaN family lipoprotein [Methyloversatilis sp.]